MNDNMDQGGDKEERKREYNRLAQREFRRRRKQHLKNLEQAQKEHSSDQSEELERLRYQNDELRRENENLRAQISGSSGAPLSSFMMPSSSMQPTLNDGRRYSLSPSISSTSISGTTSPPAALSSDMMPMAALSLTSSMLSASIQAYADQSALPPQPYSMVYPSGLHQSSQSSPGSSEFRSRSAMGPPFHSLSTPQSVESQAPQVSGQRQSHMVVPFDLSRARSELLEMFRPLCYDASVISSSERHLGVLRSLSETLPSILKPSRAQLETPHYYGIDMIASPSLRDRLMTVTREIAQSFVAEIEIIDGDSTGQLTIWGDDPLNEMSWEFSWPILERWGWLLGRDWVNRANWWRRQRGANLLPEW